MAQEKTEIPRIDVEAVKSHLFPRALSYLEEVNFPASPAEAYNRSHHVDGFCNFITMTLWCKCEKDAPIYKKAKSLRVLYSLFERAFAMLTVLNLINMMSEANLEGKEREAFDRLLRKAWETNREKLVSLLKEKFLKDF